MAGAIATIRKAYTSIFNVFLYLLPVFVVLGIFDYRFHNYFWPGEAGGGGATGELFFRLHPGLAMFDFFSILDFYLLIVFGLYILGVLGLQIFVPRLKWRWQYLSIAFVVLGLIVAGVSYNPSEPVIKSFWFEIYHLYVTPVALFFVLAFAVKDRVVFRQLQISLMGVLSLFGMLAIYEYFSGALPGDNLDFLGRLVWPYIDPFVDMKYESANWLSYIFGPGLILGVVSLREKLGKGLGKWLNKFFEQLKKPQDYFLEGLCIVVSLVVLLLTKSYTGIGITALILGLYVFISVPKKTRKYLVIGFVVLLMVGIASQYNTRKFQILIGNDTQETSLHRRAQIYTFNYEALKENVFVGIGPGNYQSYFRENQERFLDPVIPELEIPPHPHNLLTGWWSDLGIFGMVGMLLIYVMAFVEFFRKKRSGFVLVLIYFLGHGFLDLPYSLPENTIMFWMFLAFLFIDKTLSEKRSQAKKA
ncbi:O-antigen ligase family protein [Candidatus Peregrinibacteria bacterium]|jgi:hypothetical protein|nr:O-antigen ligase family protein [Candidatus Peregrinibacteria bacterium]MBT4055786.1 O-antigen ligase family protein [Candidatus Peregrinibacteria bacterium]